MKAQTGKIVPYTVFQPFVTNQKENNHNWKVESADKGLEKSARVTSSTKFHHCHHLKILVIFFHK